MTMLLLPRHLRIGLAGFGTCVLFGACVALTSSASAQSVVSDSAGSLGAQSDSNPMYRCNPQRTGSLDITLQTPLSVAWQNTTTAVDGNTSAPVEDGGAVFFGDAGKVYALNVHDGAILWTYPTSGTAGPFYGSPEVADGKVFIGGDDDRLYALDEKTGDSLWQIVTGAPVRSAPVVDGGIVYFGSMDTKLYSVREDNQQPFWGGPFRTTGPITTPVTIAGSEILFADGNDTLYAVEKATGRMMWSAGFNNGLTDTPAVYSNGTIIVASDRGIYGLSPDVGHTKWHIRLASSITAPLALSPDASTIYAMTALGSLVAIDARGKIEWSVPLDATTKAAPIATQNSVIVAATSGVVMALSAQNGALQWSYSLLAIPAPGNPKYTSNGVVTAAPLVTPDGSIYTLGNDGTLTAFKPGAVDEIPPTATLNTPSTTQKVAGAQIGYSLKVVDAGSGINPSSVSLKVDGAALPVEYSPKTNLITVKTTSAGMLYGTAPVTLDTLADGPHTLVLKVADWRGNQLIQTWHFTVDDGKNPAGSSPAIAAPNQTGSTDDSSASQASGTDSSAGQNNGGFPSAPGSGGAAPGGSVPGGSPAGTPSAPSPQPGGGGGPTISGGTPPIPVPGAPPTPVAPPPGATNFPPPPPI